MAWRQNLQEIVQRRADEKNGVKERRRDPISPRRSDASRSPLRGSRSRSISRTNPGSRSSPPVRRRCPSPSGRIRRSDRRSPSPSGRISRRDRRSPSPSGRINRRDRRAPGYPSEERDREDRDKRPVQEVGRVELAKEQERKRFEREDVSSDVNGSSLSDLEDRKEAKRRRKEERKED